MKQPRQTMKATDLFEIEKVQIFDKLTGNWICTVSMFDSTGDTRKIEDYEIKTETIEPETDRNQLELF
jgi:hypothetical protein